MSRPYFFVLLCALCALVPAVSFAGSFTANPVRLVIPAGANSTSLLLENKGEEPVLVQAEVMAWSQEGGKDVLTATQDVVVSPPIFKVATGGSQTVRVGLLKPAAADRETTYRIFLQEVPQPPPPGQQGVSVALRLGLPLFVVPKGNAAAQLRWTAKAADGDIVISATNSGNAHAQVLDYTLRRDGAVVAEQQLGAYVLAGQTRTWQVKPSQPWRGGKLTISARTTGGEVTAELAPD